VNPWTIASTIISLLQSSMQCLIWILVWNSEIYSFSLTGRTHNRSAPSPADRLTCIVVAHRQPLSSLTRANTLGHHPSLIFPRALPCSAAAAHQRDFSPTPRCRPPVDHRRPPIPFALLRAHLLELVNRSHTSPACLCWAVDAIGHCRHQASFTEDPGRWAELSMWCQIGFSIPFHFHKWFTSSLNFQNL
jgi:hypothetical protein